MEDASDAILAQATAKDRASSEKIVEASEAVFDGSTNIMKSAVVSQKSGEVRKKGEQIATMWKSPTMPIKYVFYY